MPDPSLRAPPRPVPFRGGGFAPGRNRLIGALALLALIALWELGSRKGWIDPWIMPSPLDVGRALRLLMESGELWRHLSASLTRLGLGWVIGTAAGLALGVAIGLFTAARAAGLPLVSALFPVPKIALLPLFVVWFGIGEESKIATIAFGVFFPTAISAAGGVDNVDRTLIRMAQSFGLPHGAIVRKVVLPGALPAILSGFRISTSIAIILLVAAEMIGAQEGIGAFVLAASNLMQTDRLLAGVMVLSLIGLAASGLIGAVERIVLRWR